MIRIAESEWIIMKELWKETPLTSRQIIDNIGDRTDWNDKTIHTLISRLCKKGAIKSEKKKGSPFYSYHANISEEECVKEETKNFIQRMYAGSLKNLVSTFAPDESVTKNDIQELRNLLDELEKGKRK